MFKRKALRAVAGMLFGAAAGILWGAWYNANKGSALVPPGDVEQMHALLEAIMLGSAVGFFIGLVVGLARNSMVTGIVAGLSGAIVAVLLPPGFPLTKAADMQSGILVGASVVGLLVVLAALLIPKKETYPIPDGIN